MKLSPMTLIKMENKNLTKIALDLQDEGFCDKFLQPFMQ